MRRFAAFCLCSLLAVPAWAGGCSITIGDIVFKEGDVDTTSVVNMSNAQMELEKGPMAAFKDLAEKQDTTPTPVRIGSFSQPLVLKDLIAKNAAGEWAVTIPTSSNADGLVLQQAMKGCS